MISLNLTEDEFSYLHIALIRAIITTEERIKHIERRSGDERLRLFAKWDEEDKAKYRKDIAAFKAAQAAMFKEK